MNVAHSNIKACRIHSRCFLFCFVFLAKSPQVGVDNWRHLAIKSDYYDNK